MRWILWSGRFVMVTAMIAALLLRPDPRVFFGCAVLWLTAHEILDFGWEIRRSRVQSWVPGKTRKPRGWRSLGEWDRRRA